MESAQEITEMKTGGLVVWNKEDFLAVYRGCNYLPGSRNYLKTHQNSVGDQVNLSLNMSYQITSPISRVTSSGSSPYKINNGIEGRFEQKQRLIGFVDKLIAISQHKHFNGNSLNTLSSLW